MMPYNDPGSAAAADRVAALETVAAEPLEVDGSGRVLVGTASWTDPTMTAVGRVLPGRGRQRRGAAPVLRVDIPGRRGRRDVLRAARRADLPAMGGPDAAGLHVRHQGPRADDRPGHGDEAPPEGDPREPARGAAGQEPDLREGPARRAPRRGLADVPRRPGARSPSAASSARSCSSTRSGSSPRTRTGR